MGSTGVMVSNGDLLVAPTARVSAARAEALLHHEVGTHVVTFVNGSHQPLRILASGLAGHEETQEGLAVLAEYLVGGLTAGRLRQLAARVVAVHADARRCRVPRGAPRTGRRRRLGRPGVHDHHARVPVRRSHEGRGVPAGPARPGGPPRRRRLARHALARQDAARRGAARRGPAPARRARRPAACGRATSTTPRHPHASRASIKSTRCPRSSEKPHENRLRHQRHRDREARVHHGATRARGGPEGSRHLDDGRRRLLPPRRRDRRRACPLRGQQAAHVRGSVPRKHPRRRTRLRRHLDQRSRRAA